MSASPNQTPTFSLQPQPSSATDKPLIALNITAQINEKLTPSTFLQWRAQFEALLIGYDLLTYVEGTFSCPSSSGSIVDELHKNHWIRQDKLILSAILASTSSSITPLIAMAPTSHGAWKKLKTLYASRSRTRAMQLKEELTLIQRGHRSITDYLHAVKKLADEIAIIDHPISDDDLTLYVLNGLGPDFREIAGPIRARESSLNFEELHDLLVGHEAYLRRLETATQTMVASANYTKTKQYVQGGYNPGSSRHNRPQSQRGPHTFSPGRNPNGAHRDRRSSNYNTGRPTNFNRRYQPKCQLCDQFGHTAKFCSHSNSSNLSANCATSSTGKDKNWLLDSAASHNITGDLSNLSIHSEYDGTDEVLLGDGSGLVVSHVGSLALHSPNRTFLLRDTLCVPNLCKNLISVHHLTKQNNVFVEFHPFHFLVKDTITGATLLRGACNDGIYTFPTSMVPISSKKVANVHVRTSLDGWHKRLGHPSNKIVHNLINSFSLPITSKQKLPSLCHSCSINKAHQQPFHVTSLKNHAPLDIIYTDV
jgi:hypothetical protein